MKFLKMNYVLAPKRCWIAQHTIQHQKSTFQHQISSTKKRRSSTKYKRFSNNNMLSSTKFLASKQTFKQQIVYESAPKHYERAPKQDAPAPNLLGKIIRSSTKVYDPAPKSMIQHQSTNYDQTHIVFSRKLKNFEFDYTQKY